MNTIEKLNAALLLITEGVAELKQTSEAHYNNNDNRRGNINIDAANALNSHLECLQSSVAVWTKILNKNA